MDRSQQGLLSDTLAELWGDAPAVDLMAELTLALLIGIKQPRPEVVPRDAAWMALEWARRVLQVGADLQVDRGRIVLVMRKVNPI